MSKSPRKYARPSKVGVLQRVRAVRPPERIPVEVWAPLHARHAAAIPHLELCVGNERGHALMLPVQFHAMELTP